jgi:hypothetical protein
MPLPVHRDTSGMAAGVAERDPYAGLAAACFGVGERLLEVEV